MSEPLWRPRPRPPSAPGTSRVGRWRPADLAGLTAARRQLAAATQDGSRPPEADDGAVDRLLLAFEELVSNALRHGRGPVEATVTATGETWLIDVSDAATDRAPAPAVDRDPVEGGLGLYLVAGLGGAHGWTVEGDRKHVWARIDRLRPAAAHPDWSIPLPRVRSSERGQRRWSS